MALHPYPNIQTKLAMTRQVLFLFKNLIGGKIDHFVETKNLIEENAVTLEIIWAYHDLFV